MKKLITILLLSFLSTSVFASDWKEVRVVEIPYGTPVYYSQTDSAKIKYCSYIKGHSVNVSESNAQGFARGQKRLELVKWHNRKTDSYRYTIRQRKEKIDIDLNTLFKQNNNAKNP